MISENDELSYLKVEIDDHEYIVNLSDIKDFFIACKSFMPIDADEFEIMTHTISETIVDYSSPNLTIAQLRPQLKFLREVGFLFKSFSSGSDAC